MQSPTLKTASAALVPAFLVGSLVAIGLARPGTAPEPIGHKPTPAPDATEKSRAPDALKELEGDWRMIQMEVRGQKQSLNDKGGVWKWRGPLLQRTGPDGKQLWSVARVAGTARHLDLIFLDGDFTGDLQLQTVPCIFKFDRSNLVICVRHETRLHWGRPVDFTSDRDNWQLVLTFEKLSEPLTLKGNWEVTAMYVNGSRLDQVAARARGKIDRRVVFTDSTMTAESLADGKRIETAYQLDASKDPKQILLGEPGPKAIPGVYRIDFDTLWLCFDDQKKAAPKEFTSREDSRQSLWILKRSKSP